LGIAVSDGVGDVSPALPCRAPADGLRLSSGTGNDVEDGDAEADEDGEALDCIAQRALVTGSGEDDALDVGVAVADDNGMVDGLSDGRSEGLGPPPSPAKAVAATDANIATVAALRATDFRLIDLPPSLFPSPKW
jgi:hypothetical protein